jgi:NitT/TauT family transport system permease protein
MSKNFYGEFFRYKQHNLKKHNAANKTAFWVVSFLILIVVVTLISNNFKSAVPVGLLSVFHRITIAQLLLYGLYTFIRLFVAYICALVATFVVMIVVTAHRKIEYFILPILDILQSVPVLAFFPLIIVAFANLHLPELSAQIVLFVAMTWSVMFGALGGWHQIPQDIFDAAQIYGASGLSKFIKVIFPAIVPNLITGSILSFGAGWNVIIISEYINYGNIQIRLPGLGSLLSSSAGHDSGIFIAALVVLVLIITLLNRLVWHRLMDYSEKYKFE